MSTLLTVSKQNQGNVMTQLKACLDQLAADPTQDPDRILFEPPDTS